MPLPYQPENNDIPVKTPPSGFDALRTIAVSRFLSRRRLGFQSVWNFRFTASPVPDAGDGDDLLRGDHPVNLNPAVEKALQLEVVVTLVNPTAPQFTF